jgi:hypothetical protein
MLNHRDDESTQQPNDLHRDGVRRGVRRLTRSVIHSLHAVGMTDGEMARALGVPLAATYAMRHALDLPPNLQPALKAGHSRLALLRATHGAGCEDAGIASVLHITAARVAVLRGEWDLAANPPPPPPPATDPCWRYYGGGATDTEIAAATGLAPADVARWRELNHLPPSA